MIPAKAVPSLIECLESIINAVDEKSAQDLAPSSTPAAPVTSSTLSPSSAPSTAPPPLSTWTLTSQILGLMWTNLVSVHSITACFTAQIATEIRAVSYPSDESTKELFISILKRSQFKHLLDAVQELGVTKSLFDLAQAIADTVLDIYDQGINDCGALDETTTSREFKPDPDLHGMEMWIDRSLDGWACRLPRSHLGFGHSAANTDDKGFKCTHKLYKQKKTQFLFFFCLLSGWPKHSSFFCVL